MMNKKIRAGFMLITTAAALWLGFSTFQHLRYTWQRAEVLATLSPAADIGWPSYGGADGGGHFSNADQITPDNVRFLQEKWVHRSGDFRLGTNTKVGEVGKKEGTLTPSSFIGTPILAESSLYYCTPFNRVFALDPGTGKARWTYDPKVSMSHQALTNCRGVSSWVDSGTAPKATCRHRIFLATLDARLIALDGETGRTCPDFGTGGQVDMKQGLSPFSEGEYGITSPPAVIGDRLIVGSFIMDSQRPDIPAGVVRAYDARSGKLLWAWNPVPPGASPMVNGLYVNATTNVWSLISVDPQRNLVIVPTGNTSPDYYGGDRKGALDHYSSSVVALNAGTGKPVWRFQTVHHDIWDYDVPAQPTLVDLTVNGRRRAAVVQVTKMGLTFVLDRYTGQPIFPVAERVVPQRGAVPGEYLSRTQPFPSLPAPLHPQGVTHDDAWGFTFWDKSQCRSKMKTLTTGPIYTPPTLRGTVLYPSNIGGNNWGAPAIDLKRGIMVANTAKIATTVKLVPRKKCLPNEAFPQNGSPYCVRMEPLLSPIGAPCTAPPWGSLTAIDLNTGKTLWDIPLGTLDYQAPWPLSFMKGGVQMGGPMITATGLVFIAAAADRRIRAYDINQGRSLWEAEMPTSGNAVPMTYVWKGRQYVVIAAGGHFTSPSPPADHLIAYGL